MPLFEYKCNECDSKFEVLHKSLNNMEDVKCPECNSENNKKLLSSFSQSMGSSKSLNNCSDGSCPSFDACSSGRCGLN